MVNGRKREVPVRRAEEQEREFWVGADAVDHADWRQARRVASSHPHPSTRTTSLRLPEGPLGDMKTLANRQDIPYRPLLKIYLSERIQKELGKMRGA